MQRFSVNLLLFVLIEEEQRRLSTQKNADSLLYRRVIAFRYNPLFNMDLSKLRKQIDELDKELVRTLAKRMFLIPKVAEYKKQHNLKRYQPEREKQMIKNLRAAASELKIEPDLVEDLFKRIIKEAHRIEKKVMGK